MAKVKHTTFVGDLDDITRIQMSYLPRKGDVPDFLYFRKGEAENHIDIAWEYGHNIAAILSFLLPITISAGKHTAKNLQKLYASIFATTRASDSPGLCGDFRIIASPQRDEITVAITLMRRNGFKVKNIPKNKRGSLRYFVRPDKYCLFFRVGNEFFGFYGSDKQTIAGLKRLFEAEWDGK